MASCGNLKSISIFQFFTEANVSVHQLRPCCYIGFIQNSLTKTHFERQSSPNGIQIFDDKSCDLLITDCRQPIRAWLIMFLRLDATDTTVDVNATSRHFREKCQTVISNSWNRVLKRFIFQTVVQQQGGVEWL